MPPEVELLAPRSTVLVGIGQHQLQVGKITRRSIVQSYDPFTGACKLDCSSDVSAGVLGHIEPNLGGLGGLTSLPIVLAGCSKIFFGLREVALGFSNFAKGVMGCSRG